MLIPTFVCGALMAAVQQPQLFTSGEKREIMRYWSDSSRYRLAPPTDFKSRGLWQVRLTVTGSMWIYSFNRARGVAMKPTQDSSGNAERDRLWDAWVDAKVAYDRWLAGQVALNANTVVAGTAGSKDPTIPTEEPPLPGPMPDDMADFIRLPYTTTTGQNVTSNSPPGLPPLFAEAVVPMEHRIKFEDGTELSYQDNCKMRSKYAYYRFGQGVLSGGTAVKSMPEKELDSLIKKAGVSSAEAKVMKAVSILEGGFDSVNTYDTGYVSVGFIQFATLKDGAGSLGRLLLDYKATDPAHFQRDFRRYGIDVTPLGVLACVDWESGAEVQGAEANRKIIEDKRLIAVFQYAGQKSDEYNAAQIRTAKNQYFPSQDAVSIGFAGITLTGRVGDFIKSEAGLATLMDRKVNTGKLDPLPSVLQKIALEKGVNSFPDFNRYERQIVQAMKYRKDYLQDKTLSQPKG